MASTPPPFVRFEFSRVVERTFASVGRNFAVFAGLALLLAGVPGMVIGSLMAIATAAPAGAPTGASPSTTTDAIVGFSAFGLAYVVSAVAGFVLQAAIVYGVIADLNGRRSSFGDCLSTGLRQWFWLLLLAIIVTLAVGLGYLLLIVPGLMMATAWIVAVPAQVVEQPGVFGAIGRSADLTRGHRWSIFGLMVIFAVGSVFAQGAFTGVFGALLASAQPKLGATMTLALVQPLIKAATSLVGAAGVASIYYELRSGREGIGPETLAAVFD